LFVGSGAILALVGPAPLFMAYLSMMIVVWNVMNNLAEIVTYLPMNGITIPYFVKRFVDPSLAFAAGEYIQHALWATVLIKVRMELLVRIRHPRSR
jgi:amino acid permease